MWRAVETVFRDLILLILAAFVTMLLIIIYHVNPPGSKVTDEIVPGNLHVEIRWPDRTDIDVDLWVKAPGDVAVGYSNLRGRVFSLLRDDVGQRRDLLDLNYENAFTRGLPAGEYIINLHLYRVNANEADKLPIPVRVLITKRAQNGNSVVRLYYTVVKLRFVGEEITVVRFDLNKAGNIVEGSLNHIFTPLRRESPESGYIGP